jgi:hypothetical protein
VTENPKTLLRFVLSHKHPHTGVRDGIFEAAYGLCDGTTFLERTESLWRVCYPGLRTILRFPSDSTGANRKDTIAEIRRGFPGSNLQRQSISPECVRWSQSLRKTATKYPK